MDIEEQTGLTGSLIPSVLPLSGMILSERQNAFKLHRFASANSDAGRGPIQPPAEHMLVKTYGVLLNLELPMQPLLDVSRKNEAEGVYLRR